MLQNQCVCEVILNRDALLEKKQHIKYTQFSLEYWPPTVAAPRAGVGAGVGGAGVGAGVGAGPFPAFPAPRASYKHWHTICNSLFFSVRA